MLTWRWSVKTPLVDSLSDTVVSEVLWQSCLMHRGRALQRWRWELCKWAFGYSEWQHTVQNHLNKSEQRNLLNPKASMKFDGNLTKNFNRFKQKFNILWGQWSRQRWRNKESVLSPACDWQGGNLHPLPQKWCDIIIMLKFDEYFVTRKNAMYEVFACD